MLAPLTTPRSYAARLPRCHTPLRMLPPLPARRLPCARARARVYLCSDIDGRVSAPAGTVCAAVCCVLLWQQCCVVWSGLVFCAVYCVCGGLCLCAALCAALCCIVLHRTARCCGAVSRGVLVWCGGAPVCGGRPASGQTSAGRNIPHHHTTLPQARRPPGRGWSSEGLHPQAPTRPPRAPLARAPSPVPADALKPPVENSPAQPGAWAAHPAHR